MKNKHIGSSLGAFLKEEGTLEETNAAARERVRVYRSSDARFDFAALIPEELRFSKLGQERIAQSLLSPPEPTPALKRAFLRRSELFRP